MTTSPHRTSPPTLLPVTALKGVGSSKAERLAKLGIHSVQDILFHLPLRYQDRTRIIPIRRVRAGDYAVLEVQVERTDIHLGRRRSLLVQVADDTGSLHLRFFHFSAAQRASFKTGALLRCYGEVRHGQYQYELIHPEYQLMVPEQPEPVDKTLKPYLSHYRWVTSTQLA